MKNGARSDQLASFPPKAGPVTPPNKNPAWNAPAARPRWSALTTRSSRLYADTVNIAEPIPPAPRRTTSWPNDPENPASRLETPTIPIPVAMTMRSPTRLTRRPANGAVSRRISANADTTALASALLTPKCLANSGIAGATMPKPRATEKATAERTATSGGRLRSGRRRQRGGGRGSVTAAASVISPPMLPLPALIMELLGDLIKENPQQLHDQRGKGVSGGS